MLLRPILALLGGMGAGCFSTLGNNPFGKQRFDEIDLSYVDRIDVVKTKMQGTGAKQYKSTLDCFIQIMRVDGIAGLYKGLVPRLGRVVPGQGIIFMSFETIQVKYRADLLLIDSPAQGLDREKVLFI